MRPQAGPQGGPGVAFLLCFSDPNARAANLDLLGLTWLVGVGWGPKIGLILLKVRQMRKMTIKAQNGDFPGKG